MFATLVVAVVLVNPVPKVLPLDPPKAPPPQLQFLKFDGTTTTILQTISETVATQQEVQVTVLVNGQPQIETRTITVPVVRQKVVEVAYKWELTEIGFATVGGKKLTAKDAAERLKDGAVCVMTFAGQTIDPAYLKVLKEDIVIITRPAPKTEPIRMQPLPPPPVIKR